MATNMKTIKFGENGETYAVNAPAVQVSGELTEAASVIDFGTFEGGLTELECVVDGVTGTEGTYYHLIINGTTSPFITGGDMYKTGNNYIKFKKIGGSWIGYVGKPSNAMALFEPGVLALLNGAEKITSFGIKSYGNTSFAAGTKYVLEGR